MRTIIENRAGISDHDALYYVMKVMQGGKVSDNGRCYCFATLFQNGVRVFASTNKASDKFVVTREKE